MSKERKKPSEDEALALKYLGWRKLNHAKVIGDEQLQVLVEFYLNKLKEKSLPSDLIQRFAALEKEIMRRGTTVVEVGTRFTEAQDVFEKAMQLRQNDMLYRVGRMHKWELRSAISNTAMFYKNYDDTTHAYTQLFYLEKNADAVKGVEFRLAVETFLADTFPENRADRLGVSIIASLDATGFQSDSRVREIKGSYSQLGRFQSNPWGESRAIDGIHIAILSNTLQEIREDMTDLLSH